jgi:hypothetical protein
MIVGVMALIILGLKKAADSPKVVIRVSRSEMKREAKMRSRER